MIIIALISVFILGWILAAREYHTPAPSVSCKYHPDGGTIYTAPSNTVCCDKCFEE